MRIFVQIRSITIVVGNSSAVETADNFATSTTCDADGTTQSAECHDDDDKGLNNGAAAGLQRMGNEDESLMPPGNSSEDDGTEKVHGCVDDHRTR